VEEKKKTDAGAGVRGEQREKEKEERTIENIRNGTIELQEESAKNRQNRRERYASVIASDRSFVQLLGLVLPVRDDR